MQIYDRLRALCDAEGVSGAETFAAEELLRQLTPLVDRVTVDALGSVIGYKKGKNETKTVLLEAHLDEVGLIVTKVLADGFLYFAPLGGIDPKILPAAEVYIHGKEKIKGVIGAKPPHLGKDENPYEDMFIDTGRSDLEKIVSVGDCITFTGNTTKLLGNRVTAKSLDDRACLSMLLSVLEQWETPPCNLYLLAAVGEEIGSRGATAAGFTIDADYVLCSDVTFGAGADGKENSFPLSEGIAVLFGADCDRELSVGLCKIAQELSIPVHREIEPERSGTDATVLQTAHGGMRTAIVSVPIRYMHTSCETLDIKDMEYAIRLIKAWIESLA